MKKHKKIYLSILTLFACAGIVVATVVPLTQCKSKNTETQIGTIQGPATVAYGAEVEYSVTIKNSKGDATISALQYQAEELYEDVEIDQTTVSVVNNVATFSLRNINTTSITETLTIKISNNGKYATKEIIFEAEEPDLFGYHANGTNWDGFEQGGLIEGENYIVDWVNHVVTYCDTLIVNELGVGHVWEYGATDLVIPSTVLIDGIYFTVELGAGCFTGIPIAFNAMGGEPIYAPYFLSGSITISEGIKTIPAASFSGYDMIAIANEETDLDLPLVTSITFPTTITSVEANALFYSDSLEYVDKNSNIAYLNSIDGKYYALGCPSEEVPEDQLDPLPDLPQPTLQFNANTVGIADEFFGLYGNTASITEIIIPNGCRFIGNASFKAGSSLNTVNFPNSLHSIGSEAFRNTSLLTSIDFNAGLESIGSEAFADSGLQCVSIPNSVTELGRSCFENCSALTTATIGSSVTKLEANLFSGCSTLNAITCVGLITEIDEDVFDNTPYISTYDKGLCWLACGNDTYWLIKGDTDYGGGNSIEYDGKNTVGFASKCFNNCTWLTNIVVPNTITKIPLQCFYRCSAVASIDLGDNIIDIEEKGFTDVTASITNVVENLGLLYLVSGGRYFLMNPVGAKADVNSVDLHDDTYEITAQSLSETHITNVYFPENLKIISQAAFRGCHELESVTFPETLSKISTASFQGCEKLLDVDLINFKGEIEAEALQTDSVNAYTDHAFKLYVSDEIEFSLIIPQIFATDKYTVIPFFPTMGEVYSPHGQEDHKLTSFLSTLNSVEDADWEWSTVPTP